MCEPGCSYSIEHTDKGLLFKQGDTMKAFILANGTINTGCGNITTSGSLTTPVINTSTVGSTSVLTLQGASLKIYDGSTYGLAGYVLTSGGTYATWKPSTSTGSSLTGTVDGLTISQGNSIWLSGTYNYSPYPNDASINQVIGSGMIVTGTNGSLKSVMDANYFKVNLTTSINNTPIRSGELSSTALQLNEYNALTIVDGSPVLTESLYSCELTPSGMSINDTKYSIVGITAPDFSIYCPLLSVPNGISTSTLISTGGISVVAGGISVMAGGISTSALLSTGLITASNGISVSGTGISVMAGGITTTTLSATGLITTSTGISMSGTYNYSPYPNDASINQVMGSGMITTGTNGLLKSVMDTNYFKMNLTTSVNDTPITSGEFNSTAFRLNEYNVLTIVDGSPVLTPAVSACEITTSGISINDTKYATTGISALDFSIHCPLLKVPNGVSTGGITTTTLVATDLMSASNGISVSGSGITSNVVNTPSILINSVSGTNGQVLGITNDALGWVNSPTLDSVCTQGSSTTANITVGGMTANSIYATDPSAFVSLFTNQTGPITLGNTNSDVRIGNIVLDGDTIEPGTTMGALDIGVLQTTGTIRIGSNPNRDGIIGIGGFTNTNRIGLININGISIDSTIGSAGNITIGSGQTSGTLQLGTNLSRTGQIDIGNTVNNVIRIGSLRISSNQLDHIFTDTGNVTICPGQTSGVLQIGANVSRTSQIEIGNTVNNVNRIGSLRISANQLDHIFTSTGGVAICPGQTSGLLQIGTNPARTVPITMGSTLNILQVNSRILALSGMTASGSGITTNTLRSTGLMTA